MKPWGIYAAGFVSGAVAMWGVILWILSDGEKDMVDMTMEYPGGQASFRGWLNES